MVNASRADVTWANVRPAEPDRAEWLHSGIALLGDGRVVYGEVGGHAIVVHDEDAATTTVLPLPITVAHGILAVHGADGERLWIADPGPDGETGQVIAVSSDGRVVARPATPIVAGDPVAWRPTSVAVTTDSRGRETVWIADGYGENRIFRVSPSGNFDLIESADGIPFDCPHGLALDDRGRIPLIAIADRGNRRIVFLRLDGSLDRVLSDERLTSPSSLAVLGDTLVVTELFGTVVTIDREDRVEVRLGQVPTSAWPGWPNRLVAGVAVPPALQDGELNSPHGVAVAENGDVYVTEWLLGGRVVRLNWQSPQREKGRG